MQNPGRKSNSFLVDLIHIRSSVHSKCNYQIIRACKKEKKRSSFCAIMHRLTPSANALSGRLHFWKNSKPNNCVSVFFLQRLPLLAVSVARCMTLSAMYLVCMNKHCIHVWNAHNILHRYGCIHVFACNMQKERVYYTHSARNALLRILLMYSCALK